ncbi:MAG: hypothetical protein ABIK09_10580 [Pseudomonadota bacterium]
MRAKDYLSALLSFFVLSGTQACDDCGPACVDTYALEFDLENECLPSNDAEIYLGCLPSSSCEGETTMERRCYISEDHSMIVIDPNQITSYATSRHLTNKLDWVRCEDVVENVPQEYLNMFPLCGEE